MNDTFARRKCVWFGAAVILVVLSAGAIVSADGLARAIFAVAPSGDTHWWGVREAEPEPLSLAIRASWAETTVNLHVRQNGDQVTARYSLTVHKHSALAAEVLNYAAASGGAALADNFLGRINVSDEPYYRIRLNSHGWHLIKDHYWNSMNFSAPYVEQVGQAATIVLTAKMSHLDIGPKFVQIDPPAYAGSGFSRTIEFQGATSHVAGISGASITKLSASSESLAATDGHVPVAFSINGSSADWLAGLRWAGSAAFSSGPDNLLYRLDRFVSYFVLVLALYRLAKAYPDNDVARIARDTAGAITAAMTVVTLLGFAYNTTQDFFPAASHESYYLAGPAGLLLAAALAVWPVAVARIGQRPSAAIDPSSAAAERRRLNIIVATGAGGLVTLVFIVLLHRLFYVPEGSVVLPAGACWLLVTAAVVVLALLSKWPDWLIPLVAPASVAAVLFGAQFSPVLFYRGARIWLDHGRPHVNVIGKWLYLILPLAFFVVLAVVAIRIFWKLARGRWRWWGSLTAVGVLVAAIIPDAIKNSQIFGAHRPGQGPFFFFAPESLTEVLPYLLNWVLVGLAIVALCSIDESMDTRNEIRGIGIAMLLVLLFSISGAWLFVPVSLVLGYLTLSRVVMPSGLAIEPAIDLAPSQAVRHALGAWRRAELADNQRQKLTTDSFDGVRDIVIKDGPGRYEKSFDSLIQTQGELDRKFDRWQSLGRDSADFAFAYKGSLPRNKMGFQGFIVGLIWVVITGSIQLLATSPASYATSYPALVFFGGNGKVLFLWPLLGWCVGYFLPFIRGKDGVEKALWFSLPVIAAAVPLELLWDDASGWFTVLVYDLELFSFLMVSAVVVGDLLVLRDAGMRLTTWVRVHNWKFVVSWSSAVLAALGTAAVTFLSTTATTVSQQAFNTTTSQNQAPSTTSTHR